MARKNPLDNPSSRAWDVIISRWQMEADQQSRLREMVEQEKMQAKIKEKGLAVIWEQHG